MAFAAVLFGDLELGGHVLAVDDLGGVLGKLAVTGRKFGASRKMSE